MTFSLNSEERKILRESIINAYPNPNRIKILLDENMSTILDHLEGDDYIAKIYHLIQKFNAEGKIQELILILLQDNPNSPYLKNIELKFKDKVSISNNEVPYKTTPHKNFATPREVTMLMMATTNLGLLTYQLLQYSCQSSKSTNVINTNDPRVKQIASLGSVRFRNPIKILPLGRSQDVLIDKLLVKQSDTVKKGQIIAVLDSYEHLKASLEEAVARVKVAQAKLLQIQAGAKTGEIQAQQAEANLTRTINTLARQILEDQAVLDSVSEIRPVDIQLAQAQVRKAKTELNLGLVYAPQDGQVLKIHAHPGEKVQDEGILDLGINGAVYVIAEIYDTDIRHIKVGQKAIIKTDELTYIQGIVEEIGLQIERQQILSSDPSADVDRSIVQVNIQLNPEDSQKVAGFTNLQVNVIIDTSEF
jgi:biotin carboxyl carrier protein